MAERSRLDGFPSTVTVGPFAEQLLAEHRQNTDPAQIIGLRVRRSIERVALLAERVTVTTVGIALKVGIDLPLRTAIKELGLRVPSGRRSQY